MPRRAQPARFNLGGRGRRAPTDWSRAVIGETTVAANTKVLLGSFTLVNNGIGETIRRTIVVLQVVSDQAVSTEPQLGAFGMVVATDLAIAAGAASLPGPVTQGDDDSWFVWRPIVQRGFLSTGAAIQGQVYAFESRAMRRVEDGYGMAIMVENNTTPAVTTTGLIISAGISLLASRS